MRTKSGYNVIGRPWDFSPVTEKAKQNRVSLQLWRNDISQWLTIRKFPTKSDAQEYADEQGFDPEDMQIVKE
jgi:hypothetical protein